LSNTPNATTAKEKKMQSILFDGGIFTWLAMGWAAILYGAIFREVSMKRSRYAAALYSAAAGLVFIGLAGTAFGFVSARGTSVDQLPLVVGIASVPLALTSMLAAPAVVLIGMTIGMKSPDDE
jgi:hypothetical protein